jgi:malate dehydrogenase
MERNDLLKINAGVFVAQGKALSDVAKRDCRVLVVGNPCNTNAFIAKECARNLDPRNFFAMTMLDQNRAAAQLALKAGAGFGAVSRMGIWGNHSATQFPDFLNARINGLPALDVISDEAWLKGPFIEIVQKRGAEIIKARGLSSAASAANAVIDTVRAISTPTPRDGFFSVAVVSDGSYEIPPGLVFGYPVQSDGRNWKVAKDLSHNAFSKEKIALTLRELLEERDNVLDMIKN